ncbi:hypothetical protein M3Y97_00722800 [Aphelenchoides bicaudatus]|nr:hypothetical protein M3Y97_00722800 [Aphelenchoides bicaudatus]
MADDEDAASPSELSVTPGSSWDSFFDECNKHYGRNSESPVKQQNNDFAKMPYQKATCFGVAPLDNARYLRLMRCNICDKILKHIGYAHHWRRRHMCQPYEQNGTNSGDEAPDFLLSPPYTNSSLNSIYKQPSTSTANPLSYVSEKRDGLLLVLKRTRVSSESNHVEATTSSQQDTMDEPILLPEKPLSPSKRAPRVQKPSVSRPSIISDPDCVSLRTRSRHPETTYVELPTPTRQHRPSISIPKITVSQSPKSQQQISRRRDDTPDSVIILDDDSKNADEESRQSMYNNEPVEFSFVLPGPHNFAHEDQFNSLPPTNATSDPHSSRSSSIQSMHPLSKDSHMSSKQSEPIDESPEIIYDGIEEVEEEIEEEEIDDEFTPHPNFYENDNSLPHSDYYQNSNSLPCSSSPEMPKLERQDLYPQMEESNGADMSGDGVFYPADQGMNFPPGTLVFAPSVHNQQIFNGTTLHPVNTFTMSGQPTQPNPNNTNVQNTNAQPNAQPNGQTNGQPPLTFFYQPTVIDNEPPSKKPARVVCTKLMQQPTSKKVATLIRGNGGPPQIQQLKRKQVTTVGPNSSTTTKATSLTYHLNHPQKQPVQQRRVFNGPVSRLNAQQLSLLQINSKPSAPHQLNNHQQQNLPPPIIITNPHNKKPNVLKQPRQRNYSPVVYLNNRPNTSPSSASSSGASTASYVSSKSEGGWLNNIHFNPSEFIYYNEPSVKSQHLDLWKSKSFHQLETRDQR